MKKLILILSAAACVASNAQAGLRYNQEFYDWQEQFYEDQAFQELQNQIQDNNAILQNQLKEIYIYQAQQEAYLQAQAQAVLNEQALQQALEEAQNHTSSLPVTQPQPKQEPKPITTLFKGHKWVWTQSDNPQIGWHWVKIN
jgi:hypothetical protein